jgi:hypothetical protein
MASIIQVDTIQTSGGTSAIALNSSGYINLSNQPSFSVTKSDGVVTQEVIWPTVIHNIGGYYNLSTGRFTAPIAGRYFFTFMMLNNTTTYCLGTLAKNGSTGVLHSGWCQSRGPSSANDGFVSMSLIANLAVNDYVSVIFHPSYYAYYASGYCTFSGHFLG